MKDKKTAKWRFNMTDALILLLILAVGAACVWFFVLRGNDSGESETVKIKYELEFKDVRDELVSHINIGDGVLESTKKYPIGTVSDVERSPMTEEGYSAVDNKMVISEKPEYSTVVVTVTVDAVKTAAGYSINGYNLILGTKMYVRLPDFCGECFAVTLTEMGK